MTVSMTAGRVLVEKFNPKLIDWLGERAEVVVVDPWAEPQRWEEEAPRVDAVISRKGKITRRHIEESRGRLKIIARTGVGVDVSRVDVDAAREHKVWVTNMPGINAAAVAELAGKTLGIVGMGNIGTRVALRARAFEMQLLVCDPYIPASHVTALGGRWVGLGELFAQSDFVTLHLPFNKETKHLVGAKELAVMKKSAFLLNLARGGVLDEQALLEVLREKRIAGAAIDVMESEPPARDHPLLALDNILMTPHLGGSSRESQQAGEWGAAEEVMRVLQGEAPHNPVIEGKRS